MGKGGEGQSYDTELVCVCVCKGGGGTLLMFCGSVLLLGSLKPFNGRGGRKGLWQNTDFHPPVSPISCHPFFSSTLSHPPSIPSSNFIPSPSSSSSHPPTSLRHSSFIYPFAPSKLERLPARCVHVCLCMLDAHFIDRLRL